MSRRPSKTVQGAIIGGIVAVIVHVAVRFLIRHWMPLLFIWFMSGVLTSCGG
jgi:CDP-diglyceride synthetase